MFLGRSHGRVVLPWWKETGEEGTQKGLEQVGQG